MEKDEEKEEVKIQSDRGQAEKPAGLLHQFGKISQPGGTKALPLILAFLIILAGVGTGYLLSGRQVVPIGERTETLEGGAEKIFSSKRVGIKDPEAFRDSAEGVLEVNEGEFTTEGSHKLIRPGGESQTAYLTSSVVDLDQFVGRRVKVWGETFQGQKAGWFMDVGLIEVLE